VLEWRRTLPSDRQRRGAAASNGAGEEAGGIDARKIGEMPVSRAQTAHATLMSRKTFGTGRIARSALDHSAIPSRDTLQTACLCGFGALTGKTLAEASAHICR
jgi:hypothetical protein